MNEQISRYGAYAIRAYAIRAYAIRAYAIRPYMYGRIAYAI